jgi:Fur family peroxide stress response transcriptional regulator
MTLRITKKRQQILNVLKKQHGTLSAAQIHTKLPQIDLVTIYRNLGLFVKEKLIKQIHLGTDEAQYEYQHESHHHAVCIECEKVIHFTAPDVKIKKLLGLEDFQVDEIEVTVRGICNHKK